MKEEKIINEKLDGYRSEVNPAEIWAAIEPQVDVINAERRRKKRAFWFFLLTGVLSAGMLTYTLIPSYSTEGLTQKQGLDTSKSTQKQPVEDLYPNSGVTDKTDLSEVTPEISPVSPQTSNAPTKGYSDEKLTEISTSDNTKASGVSTSQKPANAPVNTEKSKYNSGSEINIKDASTKQNLSADNSVAELQKSEFLPAPVAQDKYESVEILSQGFNYLEVKELEAQLLVEKLIGIPQAESSFDYNNRSAWTFEPSLFYGLNSINRSFSLNNSDSLSQVILPLRRASETTLEAQTYGVDLGLRHKSGFMITSGIQSTLISERYDNFNTIIENDTITGVVEKIIDLNGDTTEIIGTVNIERVYRYEKQIYNRYRTIDIPLLVSYDFSSENWAFGVQGGIIANISLRASGQARNGTTGDINFAEVDIFESSVGLSYYGGTRISYAADSGLVFTLAPNLRVLPKSFTKNTYALSQRYALFGVRASVGYRF